ncbi:Uncharacterised protein [Streptococcus pneumoniae]|nr:Uncharacterised protein [Streptococcus pneumoniae]
MTLFFLTCIVLVVEEKFCLVVWIGSQFGIGKNKLVLVIIVDFADLLVHETFKDIIGC